MKKGLLIINLGTPKQADIRAVRRYLKEFLLDKRVINVNKLARYLLVYGFILPFRTRQSLHAYQTIWTQQGSPLLLHSNQLLQALQTKLAGTHEVALAMRYQQPSIQDGLKQLQHCDDITILPLYPQYSSAATGSSIEKTLTLLAQQPWLPSIRVIHEFYQHPAFVMAQAKSIAPFMTENDCILFSYHGLPQHHLKDTGCHIPCIEACPQRESRCYRAQCFETSRRLANTLNLQEHQYVTAFQSRLGKTPWIQPYTDDILYTLHQRGIRKLAVVCPSFVADCLETLEEIGYQLRQQWLALGQTSFTLIPCLNDSPAWVEAITDIIAS